MATAMKMNSRSRPVVTAMVGAAAVTAQFVSGKAVRDALFLTSLDLTALPAMLMATSVCSILLVAANARAARWMTPSTLVPASFAASGALLFYTPIPADEKRAAKTLIDVGFDRLGD